MTIRAILFDLDGVLYQGETPVPGASQTIEWARRLGIPHLFLTNTSSRPRRALREKLSRMGIQVDEGQLFTPPVAARQWLQARISGPVALFVPQATAIEFQGLPLLEEDAEQGAAAVVLGDLGEGWDFSVLNRAFRLLMAEPRPALVALGMTRYWRAADGLRLDVGPYVAALEYATGIEPTVLGKPSRAFFGAALKRLGAQASQTLMVGDDIRGDVQGAQRAGLQAVLVRTGKFRPGDLELGVRPQAVLDSIVDLPAWWGRRQP